jgi:hypothetical protein
MRTKPDQCDFYQCDQTATVTRGDFQWCARHDAIVGVAEQEASALIAQGAPALNVPGAAANPAPGEGSAPQQEASDGAP